MNQDSDMLRRTALVTAVLLLMGAAGAVYAGGLPKVPKGNQTSDQGPYGLPGLKKVTEACSLSHDEEQSVLRVYDDYKHKEHEEMQAKEKAASSSGKSDCINAVKQVLPPDEQKKFDELVGGSGKKKKKT
ncbi:MAG TPA: hypothetical protein VE981_03480 [Planctomycetota bacterium]|nr:hypothetical protein [Planctomycetota bacterium]